MTMDLQIHVQGKPSEGMLCIWTFVYNINLNAFAVLMNKINLFYFKTITKNEFVFRLSNKHCLLNSYSI